MIKFEKVSAFKDVDFNLPMRKTAQSAGYDFEVAQDTIVPPFEAMYNKLCDHMVSSNEENTPITLEDIAKYTKTTGTKLTLVPTGVKCYLEPDTYLELSMRSSTPLKHWLVMGNSVGRLLVMPTLNRGIKREGCEMLIRTEGLSKTSQGQRIGSEKI